MRPSPVYWSALEDSKAIHKGKQFTGKFLRPHAPFIKEIIDRLGCKTVLDYGCGKGQQYEWVIPSTGQTIEQFWGVTVTKYDPAYPPFANEPEGTFDLVICNQVLGQIPVTDIPWVVDRLYSLATKALYVGERLGAGRKEVGERALRTDDWGILDWQECLRERAIPDEIEVTLATREIVGDQKLTKHFVWLGHNQGWDRVTWPPHVRAMNHKWAPDA